MLTQEKLCFIQFLHPGGEHRPDQGRLKNWNTGNHKRKFLKNRGRCIFHGESFEGDLLFWAEWEPQSEVIAQVSDPLAHGPRYVYAPFYAPPASCEGLQNTDPFVFDQFIYTCCQQYTKTGPTQLRYLAKGSVILFGSCVGERDFALDTVFVVNDWLDHDISNFEKVLSGKIPPGYKEVTLATLYDAEERVERSCGGTQRRRSFRLYRGATVKDPVERMFSFFPCIPSGTPSRGFERPVVRIPRVIARNLKQGKRLNPQSNLSHVAEFWSKVVDQVYSQGLWLGIHSYMPKRRAC